MGEGGSRAMTDREKYLFDVQGYLVVRQFLTPAEVARLNAAIDANREKMTEHEGSYLGDSKTLGGESKRGVLSGMLEWEHPWCEPFRELLAHPKAIPYLDTILTGTVPNGGENARDADEQAGTPPPRGDLRSCQFGLPSAGEHRPDAGGAMREALRESALGGGRLLPRRRLPQPDSDPEAA
jgi:hypothetical protein